MNIDPEYAAALFESGRQDAMQDQAEAMFEREFAERIAEDTRAALIERCAADKELAAEYLDYCAEFGPVTRSQWVAALESGNCDLWTQEYDAQACELRSCLEDQ